MVEILRETCSCCHVFSFSFGLAGPSFLVDPTLATCIGSFHVFSNKLSMATVVYFSGVAPVAAGAFDHFTDLIKLQLPNLSEMVSGIIMGSLVSKLSCSWRKGRQTLGASFSQFVKLSQRFRIFLMGREILRKIAECMLLVWIGF